VAASCGAHRPAGSIAGSGRVGSATSRHAGACWSCGVADVGVRYGPCPEATEAVVRVTADPGTSQIEIVLSA